MVELDWTKIYDGLTNKTFVGLPPSKDAERVRTAVATLQERAHGEELRAQRMVHDAELKAEWWSGVMSGVICTIGMAILTVILRMWI